MVQRSSNTTIVLIILTVLRSCDFYDDPFPHAVVLPKAANYKEKGNTRRKKKQANVSTNAWKEVVKHDTVTSDKTLTPHNMVCKYLLLFLLFSIPFVAAAPNHSKKEMRYPPVRRTWTWLRR